MGDMVDMGDMGWTIKKRSSVKRGLSNKWVFRDLRREWCWILIFLSAFSRRICIIMAVPGQIRCPQIYLLQTKV